MSHSAVDGTTVITNLLLFCKGSEKRVELLEAIRKKKNYAQVAKEIHTSATYCSRNLKRASSLGLVEGKRGDYRQTAVLRGVNIRSILRDAAKESGRSGMFIAPQRKITAKFADGLEVPNLGLPQSIVSDAQKMAKVYPYLYVFENSVRYLIIQKLEAKYGKDWWDSRVSRDIKEKASERIEKEGKNRWHSKRGAHPIFYTDIDELRSIITSNPAEFNDVLPDVRRPLEWISQRIEEISMSRNIVAHNNPLADNDINRVKIYFKDWAEQVRNRTSS